jgi:DNA invertase Pin-like site-specific DNA recombinase
MLGVFSELEREMIVACVNAGIARARQSGTRSGKAIGRPQHRPYEFEGVREALIDGASVRKAAALSGASVGAVAAVRKKLLSGGVLK